MNRVEMGTSTSIHRQSAVSTFMRGINKATEYKTDDTSIIDLADNSAQNKENKTSVTIALEDFSDKFKSFHGQNTSNITAKDCQKSFLQNVKEFFGAKPSTNIYESQQGQELLEEKGSITQNDIFHSENAKNDGIRYAQEGASIEETARSALNFARADIGAIETSYDLAHFDGNSLFNFSSKDGKLNDHEIESYSANYNRYTGSIDSADLDNDKGTFSAEEYASYLMVADGLEQFSEDKVTFNPDKIDGLITFDEAKLAQTVYDSDLKEQAQIFYDEYFAKD